MAKLSVSVIIKNEEANLPRMLNSLRWVDEIVVLDTGSTDNSKIIATEFGCKLYESEWLGFGKCKQKAVDLCSNEWILSIDADEVVTPDLASKIKAIIDDTGSLNGYRILRRSFYLGRQIKHCGWGGDYTLRLFRKDKGRFNDKSVHESVHIEGEIGHINNVLLHYTYPTIDSHIEKMKFYSSLSSKRLHNKNKKCSLIGAYCRSVWKFISMYFFKAGLLDGKEGFILCVNSSMGHFWKYVKLWELNRK